MYWFKIAGYRVSQVLLSFMFVFESQLIHFEPDIFLSNSNQRVSPLLLFCSLIQSSGASDHKSTPKYAL